MAAWGHDIQRQWLALALAAVALNGKSVSATERVFTYPYEPEVFPKGASEFEQWLTWFGGRDAAVGQEHYSRWEVREELSTASPTTTPRPFT